MTHQQPSEKLWNDLEPDELISETNITAKVEEIKRLVDDWINNQVQYITPFKWEEEEERTFQRKALTEAAAYLLNAHAFGGNNPAPALSNQIIDKVNDRRFAHYMLRNQRNLHKVVYPALYATYEDTLEERTTQALIEILEHGKFWSVERLPYRQMEYWFLSRLLFMMVGYSQNKYNSETILKSSYLNHQPNIIECTLNETYNLTHDVFFYNNHLGVGEKVFPNEPAPHDITDLLRGLILRFMAEDNCDIVLELLLSGILQQQISRQMVRLVLSWVNEKVETYGYVPGPDPEKPRIEYEGWTEGNKVQLDGWNYESEEERVWRNNFHTNVVASITVRNLKRDWDKLDAVSMDHNLEVRSVRRDATRLGQLLKSLADYDLKKGAQQLRVLAESPVITEYTSIFQEAILFIENQETNNGKFGYWTDEEILYANAGNSPEKFRNQLVKPVNEACWEALKTAEGNNRI